MPKKITITVDHEIGDKVYHRASGELGIVIGYFHDGTVLQDLRIAYGDRDEWVNPIEVEPDEKKDKASE